MSCFTSLVCCLAGVALFIEMFLNLFLSLAPFVSKAAAINKSQISLTLATPALQSAISSHMMLAQMSV